MILTLTLAAIAFCVACTLRHPTRRPQKPRSAHPPAGYHFGEAELPTWKVKPPTTGERVSGPR